MSKAPPISGIGLQIDGGDAIIRGGYTVYRPLRFTDH